MDWKWDKAVVLVTFLLVWRGTMAKATYKRKDLIWGLAYSFRRIVHDHHGRQLGGRQVQCRSSR